MCVRNWTSPVGPAPHELFAQEAPPFVLCLGFPAVLAIILLLFPVLIVGKEILPVILLLDPI